MTTLRKQATKLAKKGRGGDKYLLHLSRDELLRLMETGGVTRNPKTGLPEAYNLGHAIHGAWEDVTPILPAVGAIAGGYFGGPWGAAAGGAAGTYLAGGSTKDAARSAAVSGVLSYGAGELFGGGGAGEPGASGEPGVPTGNAPSQFGSPGEPDASGFPGDPGNPGEPGGTPSYNPSVYNPSDPGMAGGMADSSSQGIFSDPSMATFPTTDSGGDSNFLRDMFGKPTIKGTLKGVGNSYLIYNAIQQNKYAREAAAQRKAQAARQQAYADELQQLSANPNSITSRPGYQFGLDQGNQAIQRQRAAQGGGGGELIDLKRYSEGYAGQYLSQEQQRLQQLMGMGGNLSPATAQQSQMEATNATSAALWNLGYGPRSGG